MRRFLCTAALLWAGAALAAGPTVEPILHIEAGMHASIVKRIALDPSGRWLVTVSDDKSARIWDVPTGQLQGIVWLPEGPGNEGEAFAVAFSPDASTIAIGGWTGFSNGQADVVPAEGHNIYLVDRATGSIVRRIGGLPNVVVALEFSPDGQYLATGIGRGNGIRVFRVDSGAVVGKDEDYGDSSEGMDFARDGRLVTSSYDGFIRLYRVGAAGLRLLAKEEAPGGRQPVTVRFSPDGRLVAVGFADSGAVSVLDGVTLGARYAPDTSSIREPSLAVVAWSADGTTLYGGGRYMVNRIAQVRRWSDAGRGPAQDIPVATDTIRGLRALPGGELIFGSADPAWGVLDGSGQRIRFVAAPNADFRNNIDGLRVARDAGTVRFAYRQGRDPARFDVDGGLSLGEETSIPLSQARFEAPGLAVTEWHNSQTPKLNGKPLELRHLEIARALAITPDASHFLIGADWSLHLFDAEGKESWQVTTPAATWAVNISGDGRTAVAAFADGTLRWYDLQNGREKLAFYAHADHKRWVAWTPSGYYQASAGGEDLIGWVVNRGADSGADFFPASRFRARFNRPDVIAQAVNATSEANALRAADLAAGRQAVARPVTVQAVLPPVIEIRAPREGATVSGDVVTIRYATRAPNDAPVTDIRVRVNGAAVTLPGTRGLAPVATGGEREVQVPLRDASSTIQLFAENRNGVSTPASLRVNWAAPARTAESTILKPKLYVLAVGVAKYQNPTFNLGLPSKDARDFAAVLTRQKGLLYSDVQVRLLVDADATKDNILDGLDWLQHQVTARDVGMMFLAGHGMNDSNNKYFFLPHNADPEKLLRTAVPNADIKDALGSLAGKVVFFIDTCHSGNALGTARTRGVMDVSAFVNDLASAENGVVVFAASTGSQLSLEDPAWGNGAFTKAVVEGLSGGADLERSGKITLKALDYFIDERVKALTGGRQSPISIAPKGIPDFPVAVVAR